MPDAVRFLDDEDHAFDTAMCALGYDDRHISDYSDDLLLDTIDLHRAGSEELGPVPIDMQVEAMGRGFLIRA